MSSIQCEILLLVTGWELRCTVFVVVVEGELSPEILSLCRILCGVQDVTVAVAAGASGANAGDKSIGALLPLLSSCWPF